MSADPAKPPKAERQADVSLTVSYPEARLADLLEPVRNGVERYDSGETRDALDVLPELGGLSGQAVEKCTRICTYLLAFGLWLLRRPLSQAQRRGIDSQAI